MAEKKPEEKKAEELDSVIEEVLRSSRALVQQLESMLQRARALIKENKRLLEEANKHKRRD